MTLYDLSMVLQDNFAVVIYGNDDEIARYDGVESVDEAYMDCEVLDVYPNGKTELCVCIDDSDVILDDDDNEEDDDEFEYRYLRDIE